MENFFKLTTKYHKKFDTFFLYWDWEIDIQNSIENTNNLKKSLEFIKELINQN